MTMLKWPRTTKRSLKNVVNNSHQPLACPVCGGSDLDIIAARVAPFIQNRAKIDPAAVSQSVFCRDCIHVFLTPLMTKDQLSRIYTGYRDAQYDAQRLIYEPAYIETIQSYNTPDSPFSLHRRSFYDRFFVEFAQEEWSVIDFGGGDGAYCRGAFPKATVTVVEHDYSGDLNALLARCDVLFCAHVFEHIPEPYALLRTLAAPMLPGTMLYIELPITYEGSLPSCYISIKEMLERGEPMPWHQLVTLHEHVNHYSKKSVATLASRAGFTPIEFFMSDMDIMGMVARKREL